MPRELPTDVSLKEQLNTAITDLELIVREIGTVATVARGDRNGEEDLSALVKLLSLKQSHLSAVLASIPQHLERQAVVEALEGELATRNDHIGKLQGVLKEAESVLSNQKLKSINQAASRKVEPETLIRFAHGISKDNAVAAPLTWAQGDPARPFPTDVELRKGLLARRPEPSPMQPPPAPAAYPPLTRPPPHNLPPHLAQTRQASPAMFHPRIPPASPYQGGPMQFQRMPQSPLGSGGGMSPVLGRGPPPYPGSPRGYSPRPQFPSGLSPRAMRPGPPPPAFPVSGYQGGRVAASPRPPTFPPVSSGPYQSGPIPRLKRPNPALAAGPRAGTPPAFASQPPNKAMKPETDAVSSPDSSSSSSSDN